MWTLQTRQIKRCEEAVIVFYGSELQPQNESIALFQRSPEDLKDIHESVQMFLSEEEKEKERIDWYEPKMSTFADFLKNVEKWKTSQTDPQSLIVPQDSISNISKRSRVSKPSEGSSAPSSVASAQLKVATRDALIPILVSGIGPIL